VTGPVFQLVLIPPEIRRCQSCDVELDRFNGRQEIHYPKSGRTLIVCDSCARNHASGIHGELKIGRLMVTYLEIKTSSLTVFFDQAGKAVGSYDRKNKGACWVTGEPPHPQLAAIIDEYLKARPQ